MTAGAMVALMRLAYCSNSRAKYLYDDQIKIMKELNVTVLDIYEAGYLSADQHPASDVIHYSKDSTSSFLVLSTKGRRRGIEIELVSHQDLDTSSIGSSTGNTRSSRSPTLGC
jgi:hypothetical protein